MRISKADTAMKSHRSLTLLKVSPPFHSNLTAVKFSLILNARLLGLLSRCLPSLTPTKIVELPVRVGWENEIPYGER